MGYILHGHESVNPADYAERMERDGHCRMERREVTRTFSTAMHMLRWCVDNGAFSRVMKGAALERVYLGRDGDGPGMDYHRIDTFFRFKITAGDLSAMRRALARYGEIVNHLREIDPDWQEGEEIFYADNSVERIDTSATYPGKTRRVTIKSPSGDACF